MLFGPLFFGSVTSFNELFDYKNDPKHVVIDFKNSRVWDHSGLQAIDALAERYQNEGKKLHLLHLSDDCRHLLTKAGSLAEVSVIDDPDYGVAVDYFESYHDLPAPTDIRQGTSIVIFHHGPGAVVCGIRPRSGLCPQAISHTSDQSIVDRAPDRQ